MSKKVPFVKMHGLGNDFIVIDAVKNRFSASAKKIKEWCDRHFGIGADQLLVIEPSKKADFKMLVYNADGGQVEMCGNGIRCVADYLVRSGRSKSKEIEVETLAGIMRPKVVGRNVRVDMGEPVLEGALIPTERKGEIISEPLSVSGATFDITCVSMGNPHCVILEEREGKYDLAHWGPLLERHEFFPKRTNVEFVSAKSRKEITARVWERGAGMTLACGTGACASAVAGVLNDWNDRKVTVQLRGGPLEIEWDKKTNHVFMTGPSVEVFRGELEL